MVIPERNGAWSACESAEVMAPQRTAFKKASSRAGSSKWSAEGTGRVSLCRTAASGSTSQMTLRESPSPSSSTEVQLDEMLDLLGVAA